MALTLMLGGVDRTSVLQEDSVSITQVAQNFSYVAEFTIVDVNVSLDWTPGKHSAAGLVSINDGAGTFYFGGYLSDMEYETIEGTGRLIHCKASGYAILGNDFVIEYEEYTATDDADIVTDLWGTYCDTLPPIDATTYVASVSGGPIDIKFEESALAEAMDNLCLRTGAIWYVDNDKALHYEGAGSLDIGWDLSDTPDQVTSFSFFDATVCARDGTQLINRVCIVGADGFSVWRQDAASIALYGKHEAIVIDESLTTTAEMEERGDAILAAQKDAKVEYRVHTFHATPTAGYLVDYKDEKLGVNVLTQFLIKEVHIYMESGDLIYELLLVATEGRFTEEGGRGGPVFISRADLLHIDYIGSKGFTHDLTFSAIDSNTVAWTGGTISFTNGRVNYSIDAGNTGDMAAQTYIYLDLDISTTALQTTTTAATATGPRKAMVATAQNVADATKYAQYQVFGNKGVGGTFVTADNIATNTLTANEIAANTITADKLAIGDVGLFSAAAGKLLLGSGCEITSTSWKSLRGQTATIANAFQTMRGAFPATQGIVMEGGTTNYICNPAMRDNDANNRADNWTLSETVAGAITESVVAHPNPTHGWMQRAQYTGQAGDAAAVISYYYRTAAASFAAVQNATVSCDVQGIATGATVTIYTVAEDNVDVTVGQQSTTVTITPGMQRARCTYTNLPANTDHIRATIGIGSIDNGDVIDIRFGAFNCEKLAYATTHCCGILPWCAWSGVAYASTSTRTGTTMEVQPLTGVVSATVGSIVVWFRLLTNYTGGGIVFNAGDANTEFDAWIDNAGGIALRLNGAARAYWAGPVTLDTDHCAIFTWDSGADQCSLIIDGVTVTGDVGGAPSLAANMGIGYSACLDASYNLNGVITEFSTFGDVLTAAEVAAIWNLKRPMVDHGATDTPGIYVVDGKFRISSSTSGTGIEITPSEIAGYNGDTRQFWLQASDGKAYAGGGEVTLDNSGISLISNTSYAISSALKWYESSTLRGSIYSYHSAGSLNTATVSYAHGPNVDGWTVVNLIAAEINPFAHASISAVARRTGEDFHEYIQTPNDLRVGGGLYVGDLAVDPDTDDIWCDGEVSTNGGTTRWDMAGYTAGAPAATGYVTVVINGTTYKLLAAPA